jgi:hypothetical protein
LTLTLRRAVRRRGEIPNEAYTASILLKFGVIEALLDRDDPSPRIVDRLTCIWGIGHDLISRIDHYSVD